MRGHRHAHLEPLAAGVRAGEHRLPRRRGDRPPVGGQPQRQRPGHLALRGDQEQPAAGIRREPAMRHAAAGQAHPHAPGATCHHRVLIERVSAAGADPRYQLATLDPHVPVQRPHQAGRREHRPRPRPLRHRRAKMDRPQPRRRGPLTRKLPCQQARRLAQPHPRIDEQVREQPVALIMPSPPRPIRPPVRKPAAQPDIPPQQVVLERHEPHRRRPRIRLRLGVDADLPHPLQRDHRPVGVAERQLADQALIQRPGRPLIQRRDRPAPRGHRHLRRSRRTQPHPLIGAQIGGVAHPDRLPSPRLRQEPAEQHDVPRVGKNAVRRPYPPPAEFPEEPVELQVIRTVRAQQERQPVSHPRPAQHRSAINVSGGQFRSGRDRPSCDVQIDDRAIIPSVRLCGAHAGTLVIHLPSP